MNILLTFDNNYAPHASVVIESIISNSKSSKDLIIYIIYNDLSEEIRTILKNHYIKKIKDLVFIKVEDEEFGNTGNLSSLTHISNPKSALLRIFINKIQNDDWILYLDCDVIVQDDVCKLKKYCMSDKIIAAVTEYNSLYKKRDLARIAQNEYPSFIDPFQYEAYWYRTFSDLNMDFNGKYFCSGVMLINLKEWKKADCTRKVLDYIENNPERCIAVDQDALNHIINGEYVELPPKWGNNVICNGIFTNYPPDELEEAKTNPSIIHIAGRLKPWLYGCDSKNKKLYYDYRKNSPWPVLTYPDKNVANMMRGLVRNNLKKLMFKLFSQRIKKTALFYLNFMKSNYFSSARINKQKK